jgi:processive rubber oxygenase RoxA-like protein
MRSELLKESYVTSILDSAALTDLERTLPTEAADIDEIVRGMRAIQAQAAAAANRPLSRGTHAKGICVGAEFEVFDLKQVAEDPSLAERLAQGIFACPGRYPATVRFANADGGHRPDRWPDVRAMSFAIELPPGVVIGATRLDYSMNSASTFPINDAHAFAVAVRVLSAQDARTKWKAFRSFSWGDVKGLLQTMWLGRKQQRGTPRVPYQHLRYWSTVPFLFGGRDAIKYSAIPKDNLARPLQSSPNRLQEELVRHVNEDERMSEFDFALQFLDPAKMTHFGERRDASFWVENAATEWNEQEAPFHVVARLRLLPKSVLAPADSERFAIDVTENSTPDTRPIGSINRARWHAESASRAARLAQPATATPWTPVRRGRKMILWGTIAAAAVVFAAVLGWAIGPVAKDLPESLQYPSAPLGSNGLTSEERQQYYHLSEGGEAYPIAWLLALEQQVTGGDGRVTYQPFLQNIERFGFVPDPPSPYNPYGLPVGVTAGYGQITGQQMIGLNCTACHVGELHFNGRPFRIDGGPSMAYINAFIKGIVDETMATAENGERRRRFLDRWRRVRLVPLPDYPVVAKADASYVPPGVDEVLDGGDPGVIRRMLAGLRMAIANRSLLMDKLHGFQAMKLVIQAQPLSTEDGYGRNDAFGIGRNELFGAFKDKNFTEGLNVLPADAPVSFPHLWGMARTSWFQWGVNTNSVIERNIGQALGVGATMEPDNGYRSTVRLNNLHAMEELQYKLTAPVWPAEMFGAIDGARAERGKKIFDRTCAHCHETYGKTGELNNYQLFALDVVGTDPGAAINFERTVMTSEGPKPFGTAAFEIVSKVKEAYYRDHNTPPDVQAQWESRRTRPKPEYRTPLLQFDQYADTRHHGIYRAKTLKGIWATAPFLHNGSVPTIYDLLLPAEQRPVTFRLGTREYDPAKLGYVSGGARFLTPAGMTPFVYDTRLLGNWNTGHEWWFYPDLDDEMRYDIIEFLKTFDDVNYPGDYKFERRALLPDDVRMKKVLPITQQPGARDGK